MDLLVTFWNSNPKEKFTELIDSLELEIEELKEATHEKHQRPKKALGKSNSIHAARGRRHQGSPNAVTRSRRLLLPDQTTLILRSHLKPEDVSEIPGCHISDLRSTDRFPPSASESTAQATVVARNGNSPQDGGCAVITKTGITSEARLKEKVKECKHVYRGQSFIVTCDGYSETVNPDEIDDFFSRFHEGIWLSSFNLMPLIFSFDWPSTTLLLHSSYVSFAEIKNTNSTSIQKQRWPLDKFHDRVILPCCFRSHWTLFDVDLKRNSIRQFNSLAGDLSESVKAIAMIEERLAHAIKGREDIKLVVDIGV